MSDELIHLNRMHAEGHSKYVYFLLAATGAALGYALQKLDSSAFDQPVWFGLAAIFCWIVSLFCGCKHITQIQSAILSNSHLLQLQLGSHPMQPDSQQGFEIAWKITSEALETKNNRAQLFANLQFWLLAIGILLFATWRIVILVGTAPSAP